MKIAQPSGGGDFYESFSDLIFGTLIIFLVVVLALILQVHETVKAMDNQIGGVVTPHRFTGATGQTTFAFAILPGEVLGIDQTVVAMFPYAVSATWDIPREEGVVDPVLDICRLYLDDELLLMPVSDFVGMAGSLTPDATLPDLQTCPALHQSSFGEIVYRVYILKQRDASALAAMTPEQVRDAIGGINLYSPYEPWTRANILRWFDNPRYPFRNESQYYQEFMEDLERAEREMITPFNIASTGPDVDPPAGVRITQGEGQTIKVGTSRFSKKDFILLLGAISPGRGFVVEYIDAEADKPVAPPPWIMDEVLGPAGYDAWVVKDPVEGEDE